jgi:hypothetical protein
MCSQTSRRDGVAIIPFEELQGLSYRQLCERIAEKREQLLKRKRPTQPLPPELQAHFDALGKPAAQLTELEQQALYAFRISRTDGGRKLLKPLKPPGPQVSCDTRKMQHQSQAQSRPPSERLYCQALPESMPPKQLSPEEWQQAAIAHGRHVTQGVQRAKAQDDECGLPANRESHLEDLALWRRLHHADPLPALKPFGSGSLRTASRMDSKGRPKGQLIQHCGLCDKLTIHRKVKYDRRFVCIHHGLVAEIERLLSAPPPSPILRLCHWISDGSRDDDPRSEEEKANEKLRWRQALGACGGNQADAEHKLTQEMAARWRQALDQCAGKHLAAKRMLKQQGAIQEWLTTNGDTARFVSNLRSAWPAIVQGIQTDARVRRLSRGRFMPEPANKLPGDNQDWLKQHDPTHKTANQPEKPADPAPPGVANPKTTPQEEKPAPPPRQRTTLPLGRMQSLHGFMKLRELPSASGQRKRRGRPRNPVTDELLAKAEATPAGTEIAALRRELRAAGFSDAEIEVRAQRLQKLLWKRKQSSSPPGGAAA